MLINTIYEKPENFGLSSTRWRLHDLRVLPWLSDYSLGLAGIWKALKRLGVLRKRGRLSVHSPDPHYQDKLFKIEQALKVAGNHPDRVTVVYGDEFSVYRQPTLTGVYMPSGEEPKAHLSFKANTCQRISGAMDAVTGKVVYTSGSRMNISALGKFFLKLREAYPDKILMLVWDNWTVHRHPRMLAHARDLGIHILWLPTYAPWTNPIEKLWRWTKQEILHHHRKADRWDELKAEVASFLNQFDHGSEQLLRYVGLSPD